MPILAIIILSRDVEPYLFLKKKKKNQGLNFVGATVSARPPFWCTFIGNITLVWQLIINTFIIHLLLIFCLYV